MPSTWRSPRREVGRRPVRARHVSPGAWPAVYEIVVEGLLDDGWAEWFSPLRLERLEDRTLLSGTIPDQAALHGALERLRDLNLCIIAVRRVPPDGATP